MALSAFKIYIERNERPFNYMTYDIEEEEKRRVEYERAVELKKVKVKEQAL